MPSEDELRAAARQMSHPLRATREAAERTLIAARQTSVPFLVEALAAPIPPGGVSPVGRIALILGALKARDGLPALYELLEDGAVSAEDRPFVARALAELLDGRDAFDDRARAALEKLSSDPDKYVRAFAAQAFGALSDLRSKARVQALVEDKDPWVREQAAAVLARLHQAEAAARSDVTPQDFAALAAAAEAEGGALKPWLDDLEDERRAVRDAAIVELVKAGRASVPFLIEKLNQPLTRARVAAAQALGRLGAPEAAGPLVIAATSPAVTNEEKELRPVALRALANSLTGMEEGLAASLLPLARDPDRFVKAGALLCLGRLSDREGMRAIVEAIGERDPFIVESAAIALSEGVREEDRELVLPLLTSFAARPQPPPAVQEAILIALSRIAIDAPALKVRVRHRVRPSIYGATAATRKAAIVLLERLFSEDDPPPVTMLDDVFTRLKDDHPEVRVVAASFLSRHLEPGLTGAVPRLLEAVGRKERTVSLLCVEALRRHDTRAAAEALESCTRDPDATVAQRAAELLEGFEPSTEEWIFVPKAAGAPRPGRTESQRPTPSRDAATEPPRPSRVRPVGAAEGENGAAVVEPRDAPAQGPVVEARFSDESPRAPSGVERAPPESTTEESRSGEPGEREARTGEPGA